jgi:hypothetical protein
MKKADPLSWPGSGIVLGASEWEEVYGFGEEVEDREPRGRGWRVKNVLSSFAKGDDLIVGKNDARWKTLRGGGPFRWLTLVEERKSLPKEWNIVGQVNQLIVYEAEGDALPGSQAGDWVARTSLSSFFKVSRYGRE